MKPLIIPYSASEPTDYFPDPTPNMRGRLILLRPETVPGLGDSIWVCMEDTDGALGWHKIMTDLDV